MEKININSHRQGKFPELKEGDKYKLTLSELFIDGLKMTKANGLVVAKILNSHNVKFMFIGGTTIGCHTGRPRSTQDVDLIVGNDLDDAILDEIGFAVSAKRLEKYSSFISFIVDTAVGDREILDIITSKAGSYGIALENTITLIIEGVEIKIPTAEMLIVLKYTSAINPIRNKSKSLQDWADLFSIVDANLNLKLYTIKYIADNIVPGWGEDLIMKINGHKK